MIETLTGWFENLITWLLNLGEHYPDLLSLVVGSASGYAFTVALEKYFLPIATSAEDQRALQRVTFLFCWLLSGSISTLWWSVLDPADAWSVRLIVCYTVAVFGGFGYPPLARLLSAKLSSFTSAWTKLP